MLLTGRLASRVLARFGGWRVNLGPPGANIGHLALIVKSAKVNLRVNLPTLARRRLTNRVFANNFCEIGAKELRQFCSLVT